MELRLGFKGTEVGLIPEDWKVAPIISLLAAPIQNGVFNEPSRNGSGCKLINVIDLYGRFPLETAELERFAADKDELSRFAVRNGDMFFTRSSLTADGIAMCNIYVGDGEDSIVFDCHIIRVRPDPKKVEPLYLARSSGSRAARRYLMMNAKTTTMTTIDQSVIARLPVALPPLLEQRAIAAALSDVDALLAGLDRLIAKKRDLKQAAMQQLLTGQTRLPGFQGEWEVKRLGDLLTICHGRNQHDVEDSSGIYPILATGGQIGTASRALYDKPSVLIGRKGTINQPRYMDTPFWTVDTLFYSAMKGDYNAKFLYYRFCLIDWMQYNEASGVPSLNARTIENVEVSAPVPAEQSAIATVLSDMDAELTALESRRNKTRALKQAMMQELLTGKTRLV